MSSQRNVLGGPLATCCTSPMTGFFRTGCCETSAADAGAHVVCTQVTPEFLAYLRARGNDLITPAPQFGFAGLKAGDRWCVCARSWKEAFDAGVAAPIVLAATHERALEFMTLEELKAHAIDFEGN
ncbi:MAG: DUF2237 domain-containing protein [Deltaproteobacteria bacterium]|nr:DUF2237 domain-containing protein [Deltaproteobacteria bacterium]